MDSASEVLSEHPVRLPRERETTPGPSPRRHRPGMRRWGWLTALVLVAVTMTAYADGRSRSRESAAVASCEHQVRLANGLAERRLGLVNNYLQPALTPSGHVQQLHLADLMAARAGRVLPRLQRADAACAAVRVKSWHFSLVHRQAAASTYSAALVTLVQTVAAQGRTIFHDDATLQRLREAAGIDGG